MKNWIIGTAVFAFLGFLAPATIDAGIITVDAIDRGNYDNSGSHISASENYVAGTELIGSVSYRNFFVFDLSAIEGTVLSATLVLENPLALGTTRTFNLFDVSTLVGTLTSNNVGATAIFDDLGTGTNLGTNAGPFPSGSDVSVGLNGSGISYLQNGLGTTIALGGDYTGASGNNFIFAGSELSAAPQLVLNVDPPAVPEPASMTLLGLGVLGLAWRQRRRAAKQAAPATDEQAV